MKFIYPLTVEAFQRKHGIKYVADFLAKFNLPIVSIKNSLSMQGLSHVALRHDVDFSIKNAMQMAQLEYSLGISATYFLLHPDGIVCKNNYFGTIKGKDLSISPQLIYFARQIQDMGHEVALHNDLISLFLFTHESPALYLEQILNTFRNNNIEIIGTVAHGSQLCNKYLFRNYEIFKGCISSCSNQRKEIDKLSIDGKILSLFSMDMKTYDLKYEANFIDKYIYYTDSRNLPKVYISGNSFEIGAIHLKNNIFLEKLSYSMRPNTIQCTVHPDHWLFVNTYCEDKFLEDRNDFQQTFWTKQLEAKEYILEKFSNILYINETNNIKIKNYNRIYNEEKEHFVQEKYLINCVGSILKNKKLKNILEVGCGQGDFLHSVVTYLDEPLEFVIGVDASTSAIADCAAKYPSYFWIADAGENFFNNIIIKYDKIKKIPEKFDIIIDKTGLTSINSFEAAYSILKKIHYCLNKKGLYIYIASKIFYSKIYMNKINWPLSWIDIAQKIFANEKIFDTDNFYIRIFLKK